MKHLVNWIEIPVLDMNRAIHFYSRILDISITPFDMGGITYGLFPTEDQRNTGALAQGEHYHPCSDGIVIYLNGGNDLNNILKKVVEAGGEVIMEKTYVSEEAGYIGMFVDTEGNKLGLQNL